MHQTLVEHKARYGDRVLLKHPHRKGNPTEWGTINRIECRITDHGTGYYVIYHVRLDRQTPPKKFGRRRGPQPLFVYISDDAIVTVEPNKNHAKTHD